MKFIVLPDVDECLNWGNNCPQRCVNVKGSHKCQCHEGFTDGSSGRGTMCEANGKHNSLSDTKICVENEEQKDSK